jgi:hypothetical protein
MLEATHRTGAGCNSPERFRNFSDLLGARPADKHLSSSICYLLLITTRTVKELGMKLPFSVSGYLKIFDFAASSCQIAGGAAMAVSFALGARLSVFNSQKLGQFFAHDFLHHSSDCTTDFLRQMLMKGVLDKLLG